MSEPGDKNGAYLIINARTGYMDAHYLAEMLVRMYSIWGISRGYEVADVESSPAPEIGINSTTLEINGRYACGYLKSETGIHRLKRKSPFNITRKRLTTATVEILQMYVQLEIPQPDLELILPNPNLNRNGTKAWAKIVHIPTGISAICDGCRTQMQNKDKALAVLKSKLFAIMQRQEVAEISDIQVDRLQTVLNQPIREYQFASDSANPDTVLDFRTGIQTTAVAEVLDGKIDSCLKAGVLLKN